MKLVLKRIFTCPTYTIGHLYIDGKYFCDTLEDTDRGLDSETMTVEEIKSKKIYAKTAIPTGTYQITANIVSPAFQDRYWAKEYEGKVPRLIDVPGYSGVLIHVGNTAEDTSGCILVGENKVKGRVNNSTYTYSMLCKRLFSDPNNLSITIKNCY